MEAENISEEVKKEENVVVEPELDGEGNPIVVEPELDEDGNPIVAEEKPPWLQEVNETDKPDGLDNISLAPLLKKAGKLKESRAEVEELKQELESLKNSTQKPDSFDSLEIPMENDFDTDEEYKTARRKYDTELRNDILKNATQTNTQNAQQENQQRQQIKDVKDHVSRAEIFIKENSITPEVYLSADENIRQAFEAIRPGEGNQIKNHLISIIGDGSEQVLLYAGRSKERLEKLQSSLVNDPSGFSTAALVGEWKTVVKPTKKQISQARKPAAQANRGSASSATSKNLKKQCDAAREKGDLTLVFKIKDAAKKAGEDTTEW